jgi:hypothetical protein
MSLKVLKANATKKTKMLAIAMAAVIADELPTGHSGDRRAANVAACARLSFFDMGAAERRGFRRP